MVCRHLQSYHAELLRHTEARNHRTGDPGGLLNVIGCSCRHGIENDLLCGASGRKLYQLRTQLCLRLQTLLLLRHIQYISQRTHGTRNDRDLLHRLGILLKRTHQRVANLMIGNDAPLLQA